MKIKMLGTTVALAVMTTAVCFASPQIGSWKLNAAKSMFPSGMVKTDTVLYENVGDDVRITVDGTGADGKATHSVWLGKFDGRDYPVTGDHSNGDQRSYRTVDANTLEMIATNDGKVTATGQIVLSEDGKTRIVTLSRADAEGKNVSSSAVYDRQ